ncbi:hypothetical protein [Hydrogenophaga sp. OTU3427]|uniref:hypothetical protein n=1 Tax=Hydrogenophaga sp. OTU3427 TaxID=3043856 RepID=UPI00313BCCDC
MNKKSWVIVGSLLALGVLVAFVRTWNGDWPYPSDVTTVEHRGQFGDSFAIFSATVSALGFLGVLVTLALQQLQLAEQSKELKRQAVRDHESRARDERAQYEQLLFRLLEFYKDSVKSVVVVRKGVQTQGIDALSIGIQRMQLELRKRRLHFIPPRELEPIRSGKATEAQKLLLEYFTVENCRIIQYTVTYQRRLISTLRALLQHLEYRCPEHTDIEAYRSLVSSQITHIEIQYLFAVVLVYEKEEELRKLLLRSGLFSRDSAPYNFKLHQFLYQSLWGVLVGDPTQARKLAFGPKRSARIREASQSAPLANLLKKYSISDPVSPEEIPEIQRNGPRKKDQPVEE